MAYVPGAGISCLFCSPFPPVNGACLPFAHLRMHLSQAHAGKDSYIGKSIGLFATLCEARHHLIWSRSLLPIMKDFSIPWVGVIYLGLIWLLYRFTIALYNISSYHPLARFPGPKLAAASYLYEAYYDWWLIGRYGKVIGRMHEVYGM